MMLNLARVIKPWKEADALSAHINIYGFWTDTTFLTKSGDLGGFPFHIAGALEKFHVFGVRTRPTAFDKRHS